MTLTNNAPVLRMSQFVGGGYEAFWTFKGRYRVLKGSRASKKSKTTALWFISQMSKAKYRAANLIVIRKVFRTIKESCFTELKWAINRLGLNAVWVAKENPLEITNIETGQKIYFRGLDDPLKITSVTVETGVLCWMWIEEAYEIMNESDFDMLNESIRGEVPDGLFKQITLTFNPWNQHHFIKRRFFDAPPDPDILALTTNYTCNEWLDAADRKVFEDMRINNPSRYRVAGLGDWGIADGLVFENWKEQPFSIEGIKALPSVQSAFGLDFGYTNDPSALWCGLVDVSAKTLWVFDEMYAKGLSNEAIYARIMRMGYGKERIRADSAEPKSIDRLRELGISHIRAARKGKDSVRNGIDFLQDFRMIVHPRCVNFLTEINNYTWDVDKSGKKMNAPVDDFNHLMDAMRYGMEDFVRGETFSFS